MLKNSFDCCFEAGRLSDLGLRILKRQYNDFQLGILTFLLEKKGFTWAVITYQLCNVLKVWKFDSGNLKQYLDLFKRQGIISIIKKDVDKKNISLFCLNHSSCNIDNIIKDHNDLKILKLKKRSKKSNRPKFTIFYNQTPLKIYAKNGGYFIQCNKSALVINPHLEKLIEKDPAKLIRYMEKEIKCALRVD